MSLLENNEFPTTRRYLRRVPDRNPFISATILLILNKCRSIPPEFAPHLAAVKAQITAYQKEHLTYHWPLVNGKSRIANAPFLGALPQLALSPDADCSALQIMALDQSERVDALCQELAFYRADEGNFRLAEFQRIIPHWENSFLTWFPPKELCHSRKLESVDLSVNANVLWFLSHMDRLGTAGAVESLNSICATLKTDLILEKPFVLSPYYPKPLLILYMISRAAEFGNIKELQAAKSDILRLRELCKPPRNSMEALLHGAILAHNGETELATRYLDQFESFTQKRGAYYVLPFLSALALRVPAATRLAASPLTHWRFESEALQFALAHWLTEKCG